MNNSNGIPYNDVNRDPGMRDHDAPSANGLDGNDGYRDLAARDQRSIRGSGTRGDNTQENDVVRNGDAHRSDEMRDNDANRDPISGAPGSHPVGTGVGGVLGGAAAGAAVGTVAGPVGTVVGAAVGVVAGGLAGKGVAEAMDPTREDRYWRDNYRDRPYVAQDSSYDDYGPAYAFGTEAANRNQGRSFEDAEPELEIQWPDRGGKSSLGWDRAREPARDAWHRGARTQ